MLRKKSWSRTGTVSEITGKKNVITSIGIGKRWVVNVKDPMLRLSKMRKDARLNAEIVFKEIITRKDIEVTQICARTGMTLRMINNALFTLREVRIVQAEKSVGNHVGNRVGNVSEDIELRIIALIRDNPSLSAPKMAKVIGVTVRTVERELADLRKRG